MVQFKRISIFETILISVLILTHLAAALAPAEKLLRWYTTDDAFYYFKVAQNAGAGHGFTLDRFGSTNGFHPLWMLVCIPVFTLTRINLFLPLRVLVLIMGILQGAAGLLLYRLMKTFFSQPLAMAAAILWTFSPFVHTITAQNGLESGISAFFLILTIYLIADLKTNSQPPSTKRLALIGLAGSLAVLSRLDNVFVITMFGIWLIFRSSPIRHYLCLDMIGITASVFLSTMAWVGLGLVFYQYGRSALVMAACGLITKIIAGYFYGLYQPPLSIPFITRLKSALIAISIGSASTAIVMLGLVKVGLINGFPRMVIPIDWGISLLIVAGIRLVIDWLAQGTLSKSSPARPLEALRLHGKNWLKDGVIYFGILGVALAAYMGWNYAQFGTLTPVSGQIKEWWGTIYTIYGRPTQEPAIFFGIDTRFMVAQPTDTSAAVELSRGGPWVTGLSWLMWPARFLPKTVIPVLWIVFGIAGLALLKNKQAGTTKVADRACLVPLAAGCMLQVWVYSVRGYVAIREWYWVAELIFTCLAACVALNCLVKLVRGPHYQKLAAFTGMAVLSLLVMRDYTLMVTQRLLRDTTNPEHESYLAVVKRLEDATEPGSVIGMTGGGDMAYFIHDRIIVNLDGLINSYAYFTALKESRAAEYLASIKLNYVYGKAVILTETDPYQDIFKDRLKKLTRFGDKGLYQFVFAGNTK